MRKVALIATAAATGLVLAGCSTDASTDGAEGDTVLTISGWADDSTAAALIEKFEADNEGVTVKYTGLPWPGILTQINTELVSGTASDVVVAFPGTGNPITVQTLDKGGYLADLSDSPWVSNYSDSTQSVMGKGGTILMGANAFTLIPAIYNSQALEEVGAAVPSTFSEVLDLCATAASQGKVAYALAAVAGGNYPHTGYSMWGTIGTASDPDAGAALAAGDQLFAESAWTDVLENYGEMADAGCFTPDATGTALDIAQTQVANGEALGIVTVSPQISTIQEMAPEGTVFQTAPLPATDDPSETKLTVALGAGYAVNAKSKNIDLAKKFVDLYMSDEGLQIALEQSSIYPSAPVDGWSPPDYLAGAAEFVVNEQTAPIIYMEATVEKAYLDGLQTFISGQNSAADLLGQMDAAQPK
ncbi:ABC transporter substrate-binding protein [Tessaracoccus sp. Z1128]